jgi:hypothetical protein
MKPQDIAEAFKRTFSTEDGKVVIEWLAGYCRYDNTSYEIANDIHTTIFNEGKRAVYLQIKKWMSLELPEAGSELSANKQGANRPKRGKNA